jgi:hypothetical protein
VRRHLTSPAPGDDAAARSQNACAHSDDPA